MRALTQACTEKRKIEKARARVTAIPLELALRRIYALPRVDRQRVANDLLRAGSERGGLLAQ